MLNSSPGVMATKNAIARAQIQTLVVKVVNSLGGLGAAVALVSIAFRLKVEGNKLFLCNLDVGRRKRQVSQENDGEKQANLKMLERRKRQGRCTCFETMILWKRF